MPRQIVYEINSLSKRYKGQAQPANRHINLQIYAGEIFGILGDNGAGKSTLVRQMAGLLTSTEGEITLFGQPLAGNEMHAPLLIGYMPQDGAAFNSLTPHEALYFTAHLRGYTRREAIAERERLIQLWEIEHLRHKPASRFSGGEKRLMLLATAMAGKPPVLLLDEPTNDLAPQRRRQVWSILRTLNQQEGTTIIFITHDAIEAERIIQRVGIMWQGELTAVGPPSQLKQAIDQPFRLDLIFDPSRPPQLPAHLPTVEQEKGHWLVYVPRQEVNQTLSSLDMETIDDFKLYSATLEDLYLHYVQADYGTS